MQSISKTKRYKCKQCKQPFIKERLAQVCCSVECAYEFAKAKREKETRESVKKDRAETKAKLAKFDRKSDLVSELQKVFNAYIRQRDYGKPCISCGKPIAWGTASTGGVCDAGHYMSVGAHPALRFEEGGCHAQCKQCNGVKGKGGNYANYRLGLIERMGLAHVEALEARSGEIRKYTHDELRELKKVYAQKLKELKNENK